MVPLKYTIELRRIYGDYIEETVRMESDRKDSQGVLGFGRPGVDPGNDRFTARIQQLLDSMAAAAPSLEDVVEVLRYMYETPLSYKNNKIAYWMLLAVHGFTESLIPYLNTQNADVLLKRYIENYPKSSRLPVQNKVIKALRMQAGEATVAENKGLFSLFRKRS